MDLQNNQKIMNKNAIVTLCLSVIKHKWIKFSNQKT